MKICLSLIFFDLYEKKILILFFLDLELHFYTYIQ
jgi:hypothetical protein